MAGRILSTKNSNGAIRKRTYDLPTCSAVPHPTTINIQGWDMRRQKINKESHGKNYFQQLTVVQLMK